MPFHKMCLTKLNSHMGTKNKTNIDTYDGFTITNH